MSGAETPPWPPLDSSPDPQCHMAIVTGEVARSSLLEFALGEGWRLAAMAPVPVPSSISWILIFVAPMACCGLCDKCGGNRLRGRWCIACQRDPDARK